MATASLLVRVRTAGQNGLSRMAAGFRRLTRTTQDLNGATRDAQGRLRDAQGRFIRAGSAAAGAVGPLVRLGDALMSVGTAAIGTVPMLLKWTSVAALIGSLIVPIVASVGNLIPLLMLLAPTVLSAVTAFAALKLGFHGVGDALKAGLEGDTEKYKEALKKLAPAAREVTAALVGMAPWWRKIRRETQQALFKGMAAHLWKLQGAVAPLAREILPRVASAFNDTATKIIEVIDASNRSGQLGTIFRSIAGILENVLSAAGPLVQAFLDIAEVAGPKLSGMSRSVGNLAQKFADWIREAKDSGKLQEWLDKAKETLDQIERIAGNVGRMIKAIFTGGQESGQSFLDTLERLTDKWADWMASDDGQKFVDNLGKISTFLLEIIGWTGNLIALWNSWLGGIKIIWQFFLNYALYAIGKVLDALVAGFGNIPVIGDMLRKAQRDFRTFADEATKSLNSIPDVHVTVFANVRYRDPGRNVQGNSVYVAGEGGRAAGGPVRAGGTYWVGERGPELVTFGAAGTVHNARDSARMAAGAGGNSYQISVNVAPGANPADAGRAIVAAISAYEKTSGTRWRTP